MRDYSEIYQEMKMKMVDVYREASQNDREKALEIAIDLKILSTELIQSLLDKK